MLIRYSSGNERRKTYPAGTTHGFVLADNRPVLGYGQNVEGWIGGVPQSESLIVDDSMTIDVHDKPQGKAS